VNKRILKRSIVLFCLFLMKGGVLFALNTDSLKISKSTKFFLFGSGAIFSSLRDYGTSPLIYSGFFPMLQLGFENNSRKSIFQVNTNFSTGNYRKKIFEQPFEIQSYEGELRINYERRFIFNEFRRTSWFVGGVLLHQISVRNAEHFQNSGFVADNISHFGPQITFRKLINKPSWEKKIGRLTFRKKESNAIFQSTIRVPVISSFYRPGYVFIANGTKEEFRVFDQYSLNFLSFRALFFSSSYTRLMKNGNAIKLSYDWCMVSSGNKLPNKLEFARHLLQLSFLFRLN